MSSLFTSYHVLNKIWSNSPRMPTSPGLVKSSPRPTLSPTAARIAASPRGRGRGRRRNHPACLWKAYAAASKPEAKAQGNGGIVSGNICKQEVRPVS
jgi:hypothetical protein